MAEAIRCVRCAAPATRWDNAAAPVSTKPSRAATADGVGIGGVGHIILRRFGRLFAVLAVLALAACAAPPAIRHPAAQDEDIAGLAAAIAALGPGVDRAEASRAARLAYAHSRDLARAYRIADPPLVHNAKVNMGLKPRGLCWHWAEDMERRLRAEGFVTLRVDRAIANADNPFRIDHSTALIKARGAPMRDGIVLDPWRRGGRLFWAPLAQDRTYDWQPRHRVLARRYGLTPVPQ